MDKKLLALLLMALLLTSCSRTTVEDESGERDIGQENAEGEASRQVSGSKDDAGYEAESDTDEINSDDQKNDSVDGLGGTDSNTNADTNTNDDTTNDSTADLGEADNNTSTDTNSDTNADPEADENAPVEEMITFSTTVQGETITSSSGVSSYDIQLDTSDVSFVVQANVASDVAVEFMLDGEVIDTFSNATQSRRTSSTTFNFPAIEAVNANASIIARSISGHRRMTFTLQVTRGPRMQMVDLYSEIFAPGISNNSLGMKNMAFDGDRVIFGLPSDDGDHNSTVDAPNSNAYNAGGAKIYKRSGNAWELDAFLKASEYYIDEEDQMGWSVAISGDLAFVGVPKDDSNRTGVFVNSNGESPWEANNDLIDSGILYIYKLNAQDEWESYKYIKPPNNQIRNFGQNIALSENADGSITLAVSAPNLVYSTRGSHRTSAYSISATDRDMSGRVLIYRIVENDDGYSITHQQSISSPGRPLSATGFGVGLAIAENYLVISEPFSGFMYTSSETGVSVKYPRGGAVFAWARSVNTENYGSRRKITDLLSIEERIKSKAIGISLAIDGDYIFVGSPNYNQDDSTTRSGAVYAFRTSNGGESWQTSGKIVSENVNRGDAFGFSVSADNGWVVVGSPKDRASHTATLGNYNSDRLNGGAVFLYRLNDSQEWQAYGYYKSPSDTPSAGRKYYLGRNVQLYGDEFIGYSGSPFFYIQ